MAITVAEIYGKNQRILRSAEEDKFSLPQHFYFDPRTKSIRLYHNRNFAISFDNTSHHVGNNAVVRPWVNHSSQIVTLANDQIRIGGEKPLCLAFQSGATGQNLHWWHCHDSKVQQFAFQNLPKEIADKFKDDDETFQNQVLHPAHQKPSKDKHSYKNPIKSLMRIDHIENRGVMTKKFFIRLETDSTEHSRNVIISDQKVGDDYLAQLVENVFDDRAWFYYDHDTHRIRLASNPDWVMSNARGKGYKPGQTVIFTKYNKHKPEQYISLSGSRIRNRAHKCLTPKEYRKKNLNTLEFWICSHHKNQKWERLESLPQRTIYGDFDKHKFALQMTANGHRRVYMSRIRTLGGYRAEITEGIRNWRSWFIYDKRTKSLRLFKNRSMVLSNQLGKSSRPGYFAVFRKYMGTKDQRITVDNSRYIKNEAGLCLTPRNYKNEDRMPLIWHKCHHMSHQKFSKEFYSSGRVETYKDKLRSLRRKVKATILGQQKSIPQIRDHEAKRAAQAAHGTVIAPQRKITRVLKKFFLRLNAQGKSLNLYMSNQASDGEFLAKVKSNVYDWRSWFVYDKRTKSIRLAHRPEFALASKRNSNFQHGFNAVFRSYAN